MRDPGNAAAPGEGTEGGAYIQETDRLPSPILPTRSLVRREIPSVTLSDAEALAACEGTHAIVLVTTRGTERVRRRVMFSLASAQRAVDRAHERGEDGRIVLVRLEVAGVVADA